MSNQLTIGAAVDPVESNEKTETVKDRMQENVDTARKNLEKALVLQAKAEILGIKDWPVEQLVQFTRCQFEF